jgi:hypothetical protein
MRDLNEAESMVLTQASVWLEQSMDRSADTIHKMVEGYATVAGLTKPGLSVDAAEITARLLHAVSIWIEPPKVLSNHRVTPWWKARRPDIAPMRFWLRYRRYLQQHKGLRLNDLDGIDEQTDLIIDRIENPLNPGPWDVRGMVVGSVQSGKTANYVGLIAKALDAGYKLIIVMAGIHNNLRAQTQERIDQGILGYDSQRRKTAENPDCKVGVGKIIIPEIGDPPGITTLTSSKDNGDFTTRSQTTNYSLVGGPVILVVKKNLTPLKHILEWTQVQAGQMGAGGKIANVPLLLIDDEADNASINTKDKPGADQDEFNITRINKNIRLILERFHQSAYIGYTATPFANIFINPDSERDDEGKDLFPRDFIVNVRPSNRYIGAARVFGYSGDADAGIEGKAGLPIIRTVDDHEDAFPPGHKKDHVPGELPASLIEAVLCFVLACGARRARGQIKVHNSMLIHATHLVAVQEVVKELVDVEFRKIRQAILYDNSSSPVWQALRALWHGKYGECANEVRRVEKEERLTEITWNQLEAEMREAVKRIDVKVIHGKSKELLDYSTKPEGSSVIAIGGNKLSRGLTLEGLSVSYFLRATRMYDTLMQMGRWFGYRDGYLDLCRLYTTSGLQNWFSYVALAEVELRREFDHMVNAELTPADYGLRVRQHPDGMLVTAMNKMAHGETREVTFAGKLVQTAFFKRDASLQTQSAAAVDAWLRKLPNFRSYQGTLRWTADREDVIALLDQMIKQGFIDKKCSRFGPELIDFIRLQADQGGLAEWTVVMPMGREKDVSIAEHAVRPVYRSDDGEGSDCYRLSKANVQEPKHEIADLEEIILTDEIVTEALAKMEVRDGAGAPTPLIRRGDEADAVRALVGQQLALAAQTLARMRDHNTMAAMREEVRVLRPASRGLLIIYPLGTAKISGLEQVPFIPALALSFPATHRVRQVKYKVNQRWAAEQMERFGVEDDTDDEDE